jgi:4,5-DOPA dioxygenase extradiol
MISAPRMPAIFFGHGSPMNALEHNPLSDTWAALGRDIPTPRAILAISAHWYVRSTAVTAMDRPETIHDFGGFPPALYAMQYPAPGDPALARRVAELLAPIPVTLDQSWGLDHGTWSVLAHVYPAANIPVVQLAIDGTKPPAFHYDLAQRLRPLRDAGVLIIGSGNVVHNLARIRWDDDGAEPYAWGVRFNEAIRSAMDRGDDAALVAYDSMGEDARLAVPMPDHYLPLLYVAAQRYESERWRTIIDGMQLGGAISMLSAIVG